MGCHFLHASNSAWPCFGAQARMHALLALTMQWPKPEPSVTCALSKDRLLRGHVVNMQAVHSCHLVGWYLRSLRWQVQGLCLQ